MVASNGRCGARLNTKAISNDCDGREGLGGHARESFFVEQAHDLLAVLPARGVLTADVVSSSGSGSGGWRRAP